LENSTFNPEYQAFMTQGAFLDSTIGAKYGPRGFSGGGQERSRQSLRVESMADGTQRNGNREQPPDDETALSARLKRLGERLTQVSRPSENGSGPRQTADASAFARGLRLSSELVGGVLVGAVIGWVIDWGLGISPWGLILFVLLGFAAGVLNVMRAAGVVDERRLKD
jgi:ATP synthase protein I